MANPTQAHIKSISSALASIRYGIVEEFSSYQPVHHQVFHGALSDAFATRQHIKDSVHQYSPEEYSSMKNFLHADGKSGFAVKPDGDLVSVFSTEKGRGNDLVRQALTHGATKLDAFDGYLPKLYANHGFQEVGREDNWTPGGPQVVYMQLPSHAAVV